VTQIERARIQPQNLIRGEGYCRFQVDPGAGPMTILAGAEGIMWAAALDDAADAEYF
jgi:hypothetical protein